MNRLKNKLLFIFSLFSITILNLQIVFATNKTNPTIKETGKQALKAGKDAISKVVNSNASFLAQESFIQNISWAQLIYYYLLPLAIFALLLIVINNIIFKKNIDTAMLIIGGGITIGVQWFLQEPLNNLSTGNVFKDGINAIAKFLKLADSGVQLLPTALIVDLILVVTGLVIHNLFIDHRSADKSQGIKVVIGQLLAIGAIIALNIFILK